MKLLFELFPVILFFIAYKLADIYLATAVAIAATLAQVGWVFWRHRKIDPMLWVSLVLIIVFGGATLLLHDETFIKWKPTILYWLFASVLLGARYALGRNLIRTMLAEQVRLPEPLWDRLNLAWAAFFAGMGALNLFVAYRFDNDVWVNFKLFGALGLMVLFILAQGLVLAKYAEEMPKERS